jgi:Holliday junction resolvase RusA-like endonuclease
VPINTVAFAVPGEPVPQLRARTVRNKWSGKIMSFSPDKCTAHAEKIRLYALRAIESIPDFKPFDGPLEAEMWFFRSKPKSARKRDVLPLTRPDVDNYSRLTTDSLKGLVWTDDSQLVDVTLHKRYAEPGSEPRTEIRIFQLLKLSESRGQIPMLVRDEP